MNDVACGGSSPPYAKRGEVSAYGVLAEGQNAYADGGVMGDAATARPSIMIPIVI